MVYETSLRIGDFRTQLAQALQLEALEASSEKTGRFGISFKTDSPENVFSLTIFFCIVLLWMLWKGEKMSKKITVLGAGNGGFAAAAHLSKEGHAVTLYDLPEFSGVLEDIKKIGGITLETLPSNDIKGGFAKLSLITTDIAEALEKADFIFIIVPSFAHEKFAELCAPHFKDGQIVVLAPGNLFGTLVFAKEVEKLDHKKNIRFAELDCMMYACRKQNSTSVWLRGYKHNLGVGVFPAKDTEDTLKELKKIYPIFRERENVLAAGLSNPNFVVHVPIMLSNVANIDAKRDLFFYRECVTETVTMIMEKIDNERMGFKKNNIFNLDSTIDMSLAWYGYQGAKGNSLLEIQNSNPIYPTSKLPTEKLHRYLTEDVPFGLVPAMELMDLFALPHPTMKLISDFACLICERDFFSEARTLEKLGLGGISKQELLEYVHTGKRAIRE